jgi:exodeoxyribonuclease V gamma subunit
MLLRLHRSNAVESLVAELARQLQDAWPEDPFEPVGIVVGSRGMERWLRHQLATRHSIAAGIEFPFPRQAFDGATALLTGVTQRPDFWNFRAATSSRWQTDALAFTLIPLLRQSLQHPDFAAVRRYLGDDPPPAVATRELTFARQVAETLDRLMHERASDAAAWQEHPDAAPPQHRWLARLLQEVAVQAGPSPAQQSLALEHAAITPSRQRLHVFGLSTMGPGDVQRLGCIARGMAVHVYVLAPSHAWWADVRTHRDLRSALRSTRNDGQRRQLEADLASQNPVLAALGGPSRDLQVQLEDLGYAESELPPVERANPDSLLTRLQAWIADADAVPSDAPWPVETNERSLAAFATFGPTRQVEALRDRLLALFAEDETLEPRHVLVMTPDIETYAPLVAAIFARRGLATTTGNAQLPGIATAIADLGLRRTNPLAEVLLQLLTLAGERVTASALLELLTLQPVRDKLELVAEDLADIRDMMAASGMRWAFDAADRHRHADQPELDQNTLRFGLERLALGALLPDETESLDVVPGLPMPLVPEPIAGRERVARLGKLIGFVRVVQRTCEHLQAPRVAREWARTLTEALADLTTTPATQAWLQASVLDVLRALADGAGDLALPLARTALQRWLEGRFEMPQKGDRAVSSAVTVCAMEPMRSVPFRVVALLGMDDGAFPRSAQAPGWDPFADSRRMGERDRRDIDRHVLLEALLSARTHFWLFWSGRDVRTGKHLPAAVPVEELVDTLSRLTGRPRAAWVQTQPLQPWSPAEFAQMAPQSFDHGLLLAARTLEAVRRGEREPVDGGLLARDGAVLAAEATPQMRIRIQELVDGLMAPHKLLLRARMQLQLTTDETALETREPLELDGLGGWAERDRLLTALLRADVSADTLVDRAVAHARGRGALPLEAGGAVVLAHELASAQQVAARAAAVPWPRRALPDVSLRMADGTELACALPEAHERDGEFLLQFLTPSSKPSEKLKLQAWLTLLAARADGVPIAAVRAVGSADAARTAEAWLQPPSQDDAKLLLADLVAIWRAARCQPLPLFPATSPKLAVLLAHDPDAPAASLRHVLAASWTGDDFNRGDIADAAVLQLFGDVPPLDLIEDDGPLGLRALAMRVWVPLQAHGVASDAPEVAGWVAPEGGEP